MPTLDIRTVMFGYVLTNLVCALAMGALWLQSHRRSKELNYWLADFVLQFLAILLVSLRGRIPDVAAIVVGNGFVVGGTLLLYIGLEHYVGKAGPQRHNYVLLAAFVVLHWFFTVVQPSLLARNLNFTVALLLLTAQCAWLMLRRAGPDVRAAARGVGLIFVIYSGVSVFRGFVDVISHPGVDFWDSGLYDTLVILAYQILFIALTFALLLMRNRRLVDALQTDLARQQRVATNLRKLSSLDPLTGLHNRRFFEEQAARLDATGQSPFSILVVDVDGLKDINDAKGHAAGDSLLQHVGAVLKEALRSTDVAARIGGDEFAVIMPNTDAASAEAARQRVESILRDHNAAKSEPPIRLSFGVSTSDEGDLIRAVLHRADEGMYRSKRSRRSPARRKAQ